MARPRTDAKLKRLPWEEQLALWHLRFPTDPDQKPMTQNELRGEIPLRHGFTVAASTLSTWENWFEMELEFKQALAGMEQFEDLLRRNPNISTEKAKAAGKFLFMNLATRKQDGKLFLRLLEEDRREEDQEIKRAELEEARKSKRDAGLDVLFEDIKGSETARELFEKLKQEVERKAA